MDQYVHSIVPMLFPCNVRSTATQYSNAKDLPSYNAIYVLIDYVVLVGTYHCSHAIPPYYRISPSIFSSHYHGYSIGGTTTKRTWRSLPTQTLVGHYHNVPVNIPLLLVVSVAFFSYKIFLYLLKSKKFGFHLSCQITIF